MTAATESLNELRADIGWSFPSLRYSGFRGSMALPPGLVVYLDILRACVKPPSTEPCDHRAAAERFMTAQRAENVIEAWSEFDPMGCPEQLRHHMGQWGGNCV